MKRSLWLVGVFTPTFTFGVANAAEPESSVFYGFQAEQAEVRFTDGTEVLAWDYDAIIGTDELKFVWRSEAEYDLPDDEFETLENQFRLSVPISSFFDAIAGVRLDTPEGNDRVDGVIGIHGLAQQWVEVDADLFISDDPSIRFEAEYEGLINQRITVTTSIEVEIPLTDDASRDFGNFSPIIEVGARLSYDLIDRAVSPYIGVDYELATGESGRLAQAGGGKKDEFFVVAGARLIF
jgi:copper resistance protein B